MHRIYSKPLHVYLILTVLGLVGIYCGLHLPVSLFPASTRPVVAVYVGYGGITAPEFRDAYGDDFEGALRGIYAKDARVETVEANYWDSNVSYYIHFTWGSDPDTARKEVDRVVSAWSSRFPAEIRNQVWAWMSNDNSGFFVASFYSDKRDLSEVYERLDAALRGKLSQVTDAESPSLWNPDRKEISIELKPEATASLQLVPRDIEQAVTAMLESRRGGSLTVGNSPMRIEMPRVVQKLEDLADIPILTPTGRMVHLSDIAHIDLKRNVGDTRIIKTSGAPSVTLYAAPRPGGNIKRMAEDMLRVIHEAEKVLPPDIHYRVLVDPSQFIRSAVSNVLREVGLGSLLAVIVLFFFIGNLRNVITAAIEIPLSIILAFILMYLSGVTINLISLGGLALSAGMNVDGSVVVMENIFRHVAEQGERLLGPKARLALVTKAVAEVRLPLIASTMASLVVFVPLTFTSALSYAVLGDLAKAVVFSHAFSAAVALILVPTVRLHLMGREHGQVPRSAHGFFEPVLLRVDRSYVWLLEHFLRRTWLKSLTYAALAVVLAGLCVYVLPRLPREVIGTPDSDMVFLSMNTKGNMITKQMETQSDEVEHSLLTRYRGKVLYTFTQIDSPNHASIIARLTSRKLMDEVLADMEEHLTDTPVMRYHMEPWNPSELPIPDPPALRLAISGGDLIKRRDRTLELSDLLQAHHSFDRVYMTPNVERVKGINLLVDADLWATLAQAGQHLRPSDLADISRIATSGERISHMSFNGHQTDINLHYPQLTLAAPADLAALPVGMGAKVVPLKALLPLKLVEMDPPLYRENGQDLFLVSGRQNRGAKGSSTLALAEATKLIAGWKDKNLDEAGAGEPVVEVEDAGKDVTEAINELGLAIGLSVVLIFLVLLLQFGSVVEALLVLVAVPLGFIGVLLALRVAHSTLSLNSALGIILLNGIAVNNSIIMVDFIRRLSSEGMAPKEAALMAGRKRLRPILITSLTTILGMLPIALGFGEGGRILQPLGIAVSGGLWISMGLTLFLVPALHVSYLERRRRIMADHPPDQDEEEDLLNLPPNDAPLLAGQS